MIELESFPKEILTKILLELSIKDARSFLCSSIVIKNKCLDVLLEKCPLVLLYDSRDFHNPFKRKLHNQYKSSNELCEVLINSWVPLEFYRVAHFKNKATGDITVKYLKLIKRKHTLKVKKTETNLMFNMLEKCTRLRFFKFDVSDMKYFIQLMGKLPSGLKALEIDVTNGRFYQGKMEPLHITKLEMTAKTLKAIKINGNARFQDSINNKSSDYIRHAINSIEDGFPNETRVQQIILQNKIKCETNRKLNIFCKVIAQLISINAKSLQTIEIFKMDAYSITKYKRALEGLEELRVVKVDARSLANLNHWKHHFFEVANEKRVLIPNLDPVYPWLIIFPWDTSNENKCCGAQKNASGVAVQCKMTGTAVLFWKRFKYA